MPTNKEIESCYPIIKPEECPGKVMEWVSKQIKEHDKKWLKILSPVVRFMKLTGWHTVLLLGLTILSVLNTIMLIIHIKLMS